MKTVCAVVLAVCAFLGSWDVLGQEPKQGSNASVALDYRRDADERISAMRRMVSEGEQGTADHLGAILRDRAEEPSVRMAAARALGEIKEDRDKALKALGEVLTEPGADKNLRYTAILSMGTLRESSAVNILKEVLAEPEGMVRFKAIQALGVLGTPEAGSVIMEHAPKDPDKWVRAQAARSIGDLEGDETQRFLASMIKNDPEALVRLNAVLTLKRFKSLNSEASQAIEQALEDPSSMVREAAGGGRQ